MGLIQGPAPRTGSLYKYACSLFHYAINMHVCLGAISMYLHVCLCAIN